jgi:hypothetical protein
MARIVAAAQRARLTETAFIAESAVRAATDMPAPPPITTARRRATQQLCATVIAIQDALTNCEDADLIALADRLNAEVLGLLRR